MRLVFVAMATPHYLPMVPLAWACRAAGHEVRVVGQPSLANTITDSGLPALIAGDSYDFMANLVHFHQRFPIRNVADFMALSPEDRDRFVAARFEAMLNATVAITQTLLPCLRAWRPDLVVAEPTALAGPLTAAVMGVPLVRHLWGIDVTRQIGYPGQGDPGDDDWREQWPTGLVELYESHGVQIRADFAVRTVDPCPASLQLPGMANRLPVRYTPYNGTGVIPQWLMSDPGRRRVCVTWGTTTTQFVGPEGFLVPRILAALSDLDAEVVMALNPTDIALLGELPPSVRVVERLPINLLLPTCDAIIHQGGAGTMLTAATYGIPQVLLPQLADQPIVAGRLASSGSGITIDPEDCDPGTIRKALSSVLFDAEPRQAAAELREEILSHPAPSELVATLEDLA